MSDGVWCVCGGVCGEGGGVRGEMMGGVGWDGVSVSVCECVCGCVCECVGV